VHFIFFKLKLSFRDKERIDFMKIFPTLPTCELVLHGLSSSKNKTQLIASSS